MQFENRAPRGKLRTGLLVGGIVCALALAACGSSSTSGGDPSGSSAQSLLTQTFSGAHSVKSGVLGFSLNIDPSGSSTLTTPVVLSLSGPFQSRGSGKLPASDFTVGISALGRKGSLGVISTGTSGYVSLQGTAYRLPQSDFKNLESSFSSVGSSGQSAGLAGLGINPEHWLTHPAIVGTETVGGARTTHIRAGVNVAALLSDLNTFLAKTAKTTSASKNVPSGIPAATRQKIAAAVQNAGVDVWTGSSDKTLRKLALSLNVPVAGQTSSELGGMKSAAIGLTIQYSQLNQPQTIAAPSHVAPYSELQSKLQSLLGAVEGSVGGSGSAASGSGASSQTVSKYSLCIQRAGQDVAKMQKCAALLNGK